MLIEAVAHPDVAAPAPLVWLILRSHGDLMHRFADLNNVHEFSSQVGRSAHLEEIAETAVEEIAAQSPSTTVALAVWDQGVGVSAPITVT